MSLTAATIDRLKAQLLTSGLSQRDQPLFQVVNLLIDGVRQSLVVTDALTGTGSGSGSSSSILGQSFVTIDNDQTTLANSRQITAGAGIGFNDNGERLIISSAIPFPNDGEKGEPGPIGPPGLQGPIGATGPAGSGALLPYIFDAQGDIEPEILMPLGTVVPPIDVWTDVPYVAGDYTASAGNWTVDAGDVVTYKYVMLNRTTMVVTFAFNTTSVSALCQELRFKLPLNKIARTTDILSAIRSYDNGTDTIGFCGIVAANNYIRCWRNGFSNWAVAVNNTSVQGEVILELVV